MDVKKEIKSSLNQAEVYKTHGLLKESKDKYIRAAKLIKANVSAISNHKSLLSGIAKKLQHINAEIEKFDKAPDDREMPAQVQEIIKKKFAFSKDEDRVEIEGALALAKFGQYNRAQEEFRGLLKNGDHRLEAAKNIVRCHLALSAYKDAAQQYQEWTSGEQFPQDELIQIYRLLQDVLDKKETGIRLTNPEDAVQAEMDDTAFRPEPEPGFSEDEILDISSVGIVLPDEKDKGRTLEYDVSFQSGNLINLLVSDRDKNLLDILESGVILEQVQFYSPMAMFDGMAEVIAVTQIDSGPKKGHYSVDIKIKSI